MRWYFSSNQIVFWFSVFVLVVFNMHYWPYMAMHVPFNEGRNWLLWLSKPFFLLACMNFLIQLTFWPYIHKVWIPLLLILSSAASYAVMTHNIYFNSDMIQNIIQSNIGEAKSWLTPRFMVWVMVTGVLPAILYVRQVRVRYAHYWHQEVGWRLFSLMVSVLVVLLVVAMAHGHYAAFFRDHKHINHQITPSNLMSAGLKTAYNMCDAHRPLVPTGLDAKHTRSPSERKEILILMVGETVFAENGTQ